MKVNRTSIAARTGVMRPTKQRAAGRAGADTSGHAELCEEPRVPVRLRSGQAVKRPTKACGHDSVIRKMNLTFPSEPDISRHTRRNRKADAPASHAHHAVGLISRRRCDDRLRP